MRRLRRILLLTMLMLCVAGWTGCAQSINYSEGLPQGHYLYWLDQGAAAPKAGYLIDPGTLGMLLKEAEELQEFKEHYGL